MPSLVTSHPCSESRWGGEGGGREAPRSHAGLGGVGGRLLQPVALQAKIAQREVGSFHMNKVCNKLCGKALGAARCGPRRLRLPPEALGDDPARSPAPVLLSMGGRRPTRAAGQAES